MSEKKQLHILQVHNYYKQAGGEDTVAANEKRLLEEGGHTVYTYYRSNAEMDQGSKLKKLLLPFTAIYSLRTYREVCALLKDKQIDLVHVHNTHMMVSPSVFYAAWHCKVPVVQTLHNFRLACPAGVFYRDGKICEDCLAKGLGCAVSHSCYRGSKLQTLVNAAVTKIHRMLGTYHKVYFICLTAFNRDKLLELNQGGKEILDPKKIFVKPNFTFDSERGDDRDLGNEHRKDITGRQANIENGLNEAPFLFVGRLEDIKGPWLVIHAMEQLPEESLFVIGDGPQRKELQEYATSHGMNNVQFVGHIAKEELDTYYAKAKAVISASQCYESFPMVLTEAYAHGVPVIAGDFGNMKELVEDGVTGLHFTYNDPDSLADAMHRINESDLHVMRAGAREFYENRLTAKKNLEQLEQIYREILEKNS